MSTSTSGGGSRREFLQQAAFLSSLAAVGGLETVSGQTQPSEPQNVGVKPVPWYRRTYRWCQTNIAEADVTRYDIAWWRQHWKRTEVQGVIINAGGIVAYYPSKFPLHYRPPALGDRDLYGEIAKAAREDGITVLARMDSSRAHEPFYRAHPDWFCVDANGQVVQGAGLYTACINGPYFDEYLPDVLREIIDRSHPDGFTDNNWTGLGRNSICHCANCARRFREYGGKDLPRQQNWDDQNYRKWIEWSYARRLEVWDAFNKVTREAGGPDCLWLGMNGGGIGGQSSSFRDYKEICDRSEIVMLDHQFRSQADGLQHNALAGKMIHGLLGWDKLIPESMPMYQNGTPATFRLTVKPPAEAKMWMLSGFAGGIQPWYHHIGAYHEDRRAYQIAEPLMKWHKANEQYLVNRKPVANVGVVWSQRNTDFYGRENPELRVEQPWRGFTQALIRARIPFLPVHIDHIDRESPNLSVLIMPNIAAMTDQQIASVRKFVERGGSLVATGDTSLCDEWGDARADYALADLFGVKGGKLHREASSERARAGEAVHSYLRLTPELRANVYGPKSGNEPIAAADQKRHPVLA
ncbi:MAG TPA: alpha-amylase family protein, partial [Tepidisphaeraceae bacterium]